MKGLLCRAGRFGFGKVYGPVYARGVWHVLCGNVDFLLVKGHVPRVCVCSYHCYPYNYFNCVTIIIDNVIINIISIMITY